MVLQHYGTGSTISKKLQALLEVAQLEIGCHGNPLHECYDTLGILVAKTWIKAVWERSSHYQFKLFLKYPVQCHLQDGDKDLLKIFLAKGMRGKNLLRLSQCRISHQAMYLSCISTAKGKHLDKTFLAPPQNKERLSEWRFAREEPTSQNWKLWEDFWRKYCNCHFELPAPMDRWEYPGHRVWPWLLDKE
jgi:hypothetical protein